MTTKIEWTHKTVNLAWGCQKVSPGCEHCYAERISAVRASHPNPKIAVMYEGVVDSDGHWTGRVNLAEKFPTLPRKGRRIFLGSMTDLFQVGVPQVFLVKLWQWMEAYPQHTFQVLTKRPERMADFLGEYFSSPLPNVWGMTTVCNQSEADEKIPHLLHAPLAVRGVSIEPMLGPVDLRRIVSPDMAEGNFLDALQGPVSVACCGGIRPKCAPALNWIICGGETGPGARPMHPDWVRSLRNQCQQAGVPFFFKSWGEWLPCSQCADDDPHIERLSYSAPYTEIGDDGIMDMDIGEGVICRNGVSTEQIFHVGKRRAGRLLDGRTWDEFPEVMI